MPVASMSSRGPSTTRDHARADGPRGGRNHHRPAGPSAHRLTERGLELPARPRRIRPPRRNRCLRRVIGGGIVGFLGTIGNGLSARAPPPDGYPDALPGNSPASAQALRRPDRERPEQEGAFHECRCSPIDSPAEGRRFRRALSRDFAAVNADAEPTAPGFTFDRVPWDIGEAQPAVRALESSGQFAREVLDIGADRARTRSSSPRAATGCGDWTPHPPRSTSPATAPDSAVWSVGSSSRWPTRRICPTMPTDSCRSSTARSTTASRGPAPPLRSVVVRGVPPRPACTWSVSRTGCRTAFPGRTASPRTISGTPSPRRGGRCSASNRPPTPRPSLGTR